MFYEVILSSSVLASVIKGLVSFFSNSRKEKMKHIFKENAEWREQLKSIAGRLYGSNYTKTIKLLKRLKIQINPCGNSKDYEVDCDYRKDSHIWKEIRYIEGKKNIEKSELLNKQKLISEYIYLLLKRDWKKVKGDRKSIVSNSLVAIDVLLLLSILFLKRNCDGGRFEWMVISCLVLIIMTIPSGLVIFFIKKMANASITNKQENENGRNKELLRAYMIIIIGGFLEVLLNIFFAHVILEVLLCGEIDSIIVKCYALCHMIALYCYALYKMNEVEEENNYCRTLDKLQEEYRVL